jgi:Protein of unknown function (DUF2793)
MATSPNLGLTLMSAAMAQKETVFNNFLIAFDALYRGVVKSLALNTPPGSPAAGDMYVVASGGTGLWSGQDYNIAFYFNGWQFITPPTYQKVYDLNTGEYWTYHGSSTRWTSDPSSTPTAITDLTDVSAAAPTNGQVLTWVSGTGKWTPESLTSAALHTLTDVNVTEGAGIDQYTIKWDNATSRWIASTFLATAPAIALNACTDVNVSEGIGIDGYLLSWHNSTGKWIAIAPGSISTVASLGSVGDVSYGSGPAIGDGLVWNGSAWAPSSATMNYKFENLVDGPGLFTGHGGQFVKVDASETTLDYVSLTSSSLGDFSITSAATGQALTYNGSAWVNASKVDLPCGSLASSSGAVTLNRNNGEIQRLSLTGNVTLSVSNWPAAGQLGRLVLEVQNTGAYNITWPTGTKWPGGSAPTVTASGKDIFVLMTFDGGTTIYGSAAGQNYA